MISLDPDHVPPTLERAIPVAERWGLSDDTARADQVDRAGTEELRELVQQVAALDADVLYGWLAGLDADSMSPSDEYIAFSALTMAADYARAVLSMDRD